MATSMNRQWRACVTKRFLAPLNDQSVASVFPSCLYYKKKWQLWGTNYCVVGREAGVSLTGGWICKRVPLCCSPLYYAFQSIRHSYQVHHINCAIVDIFEFPRYVFLRYVFFLSKIAIAAKLIISHEVRSSLSWILITRLTEKSSTQHHNSQAEWFVFHGYRPDIKEDNIKDPVTETQTA